MEESKEGIEQDHMQDVVMTDATPTKVDAAPAPPTPTGRPRRAAMETANARLAQQQLDSRPSPAKRKERDTTDETDPPEGVRVKRQRSKSDTHATTESAGHEEPEADEDELPSPTRKRKPRRTTSSIAKFDLKANHYLPACRHICEQAAEDDAVQLCACKKPTDGSLTCGDDCLNAQLRTECSEHCLMGDQCGNQRFSKRQYASLDVREVGKKGQGLFTLQPLKKGEFIIEYCGEVLDEAACEKRIIDYTNSSHFYLMTLSSGLSLDATQKGNLSRFINHSCSPNSATQKWEVGGLQCVGIFAKEEIPAETEITFDYQYERYGGKKQACFCGSSNCAGWLGSKARRSSTGECTCLPPSTISPTCPLHGESSPNPPVDDTHDDVDSIFGEERRTGAIPDAIAASTRRILRRTNLPNRADVKNESKSEPTEVSQNVGRPKRGIAISSAAMAAASNSSSNTCSSAPITAAAAARPWMSFPRAVRVCATARTAQMVHLLRTIQSEMLPTHTWQPAGGPSSSKKKQESQIVPFLQQLMPGNLPHLRSSHYFQPQEMGRNIEKLFPAPLPALLITLQHDL